MHFERCDLCGTPARTWYGAEPIKLYKVLDGRYTLCRQCLEKALDSTQLGTDVEPATETEADEELGRRFLRQVGQLGPSEVK